MKIENYIAKYLTETYTSKATWRAKNADLTIFFDYLREKDEPLTAYAYKAFLESQAETYAPSTVERRAVTIQHFVKWLCDIKNTRNTIKQITYKAKQKPVARALTTTEKALIFKAAKEQAAKENFKGIRNYAMFITLHETGLRLDEMRMLKIKQVQLEQNHFVDVKCKGGLSHDVYITKYLQGELEKYIKARNRILMETELTLEEVIKSSPLFISLHNFKGHVTDLYVSPKTVWKAIRAIGDSVGVHLYPHRLRHQFAHDLLEAGADIRSVSQAMRHGDVKMTMKYTEKSKEKMAEVLEKKVVNY